MKSMHYIGLDIHKKVIAFCIKTADGVLIGRGTIPASRSAIFEWTKTLPQPWTVAMEATLFTGCGIVAASDPASEYAESCWKLRPVLSALEGCAS